MKNYFEWLAEVEEREDEWFREQEDHMTIVNQHKIYVYGKLYIVDEYKDGIFGINDCLFADTIEELIEMVKSEVEND